MPKDSFTLPSFAKINWFLKILGKREDGFHEIRTAFQTISLHDNITFSESDRLILTCSDKSIPTTEENLIVKAAEILIAKYAVKQGAEIHLEKAIPAPGGLGGGSSNAAVALLGLAKLWQLEISFEELLAAAKQLGSDVPFFLYGGTALGTGRGTEISPLPDWEENHILIVTPNVKVSTAAAFSGLNAAYLTNKVPKSILQICGNKAQSLHFKQNESVNDFEKTVFEIEFEIRRVKEKLLACRSVFALMSGSGASVFAVFDSEKKLETAFETLTGEQNWRVFSVKTISREDYRSVIGLASETCIL